jgi:integrase/recombinase XerD
MSTYQLEQQTISNVIEAFLFDRKSKDRTKRTILLYKNEIGYFTSWLSANNLTDDIEKITPDILRRWFLEIGTHRNKGGIHSNYRILRALFNFYNSEFEPEKWKSPFSKVKIESNHIEPLPEISLLDIQKLLDCCEGKFKLRNEAILKCLLDTGARANEFLDLNINDVNLITGEVRILHGKNDKFRISWLGEQARKSLRRYLKTRENLYPNSPLWLNQNGDRLKFFGLRQILHRLEIKAGVEFKSPHSFRRAFGITLYRSGIDIYTISKMCGHSEIEVTKRYLNVNNDDLREAHNRASPANNLR